MSGRASTSIMAGGVVGILVNFEYLPVWAQFPGFLLVVVGTGLVVWDLQR